MTRGRIRLGFGTLAGVLLAAAVDLRLFRRRNAIVPAGAQASP